MSWTEDHDKAASGKRVVKFYDDEGTSSVRKVKSVCAPEPSNIHDALYNYVR